MSLCIIIYAAGEYPEFIHLDYAGWRKFQVVEHLKAIQLEGLRLTFDSEIIAVTDDIGLTLWLNEMWIKSPYWINELSTLYPLAPFSA